MNQERIDQVAEAVATKLHIDKATLYGEDKTPLAVNGRRLFWACLSNAGMSYQRIGDMLGINRTTVSGGIGRLMEEKGDRNVQDLVDEIEEELEHQPKKQSVAREIVEVYTLMSALPLDTMDKRSGAVFGVALNRLAKLAADAEKVLAATKPD